MNKLIFPLIFLLPVAAFAQEILSDQELSKKFISTVKEMQVQQTLSSSKEAQECRAQNKFDANSADNEAKIQATIDCFQKKIAGVTDPKALEKLSENLGLVDYGLVPTNDKKAITTYLSDRMYQALTGVNPNERDLRKMIDSMKFGKKKQVDQKVFIELYSTQLIKNSLYEISRFCFENFRIKDKPAGEKTFIQYWAESLANLDGSDDASNYSDDGSKGFGNIDTTSKEAIYKDLLTGMGANDPESLKKIKNFFDGCSAKIVPLCKDYEKTVAEKGTSKRGANACLTKAKLQASRKAIADAKKLSADFDSLNVANLQIALDQSQYSFYDRGQSNSANSIDNLTNYTSSDLLNATVIDDQPKRDECAKDPEAAGCENFIVIDDSFEKVKFDMDVELGLKKEAEKARVKALKEKGGQDLEQYLETNGYFDILTEYQRNKDMDLEGAIDKLFEARRQASLAELQQKVGSRQMTEKEAQANPDLKNENIQKNAQETQEERARMAQVILFNNIITGNLSLTKRNSDGSTEEVGRNIGVLVKETTALGDNQVDAELFQNLKATTEGQKGNTANGSFAEISVLDNILGKPQQ